MIIPFQRSWLRNGWFVLGLVAVAVELWIGAVAQMRETAFKARTRGAITQLVQACDAVAAHQSTLCE